MKIILAAIVPRRSRIKADAFETLIADYTARAARYIPTESPVFESEADLLAWMDSKSHSNFHSKSGSKSGSKSDPISSSHSGRTTPFVIFLDSRGKQLSSEELSSTLSAHRDQGTQRLILAIGPADGWSTEARNRADLILSFGRITLPHQLARVVLAEQVYRALTILAGHPYHSGH